MQYRLSRLDTTVVIAAATACILAGVFVFHIMLGGRISVVNNPPTTSDLPIGALTGTACEHGTRRPMAVMLASDPEARPLAGISTADMVFELPVTPNGITRMMAVYQCGEPEEIGSIRSARGDFIGLAQSVDAILAHWGGEREALERLNAGAMDNIDALRYEGTTFYRKPRVPRPHNGFTTPDLLWSRAQSLDYRASTSLQGFVRRTPVPAEPDDQGRSVTVSLPQRMGVDFVYDDARGVYLRSRGGTPELDAATGAQAFASVVVVVTTDATFLRDQYISVRTVGSGVATVYQSGRRTSAIWKRTADTSPLQITDSAGTALPLEPGVIWVLFNAPLPAVR